MSVEISGQHISLTPLEYRLLLFFILHKTRTIPPWELLEHLYGDDDERNANSLEALVARLRKKIGAHAICTRKGFGYFLNDTDK